MTYNFMVFFLLLLEIYYLLNKIRTFLMTGIFPRFCKTDLVPKSLSRDNCKNRVY